MVLGIDIGGTNIKFGIVDENYQILAHRSIPTRKEAGGDAIVSDIINVCLELKELYPYDKFGIGTPGVVDSEHGICVSAANLPFSNTALVPMVSAATGLKGALANDANCAIWGELYAGSGKQYKNFLMITLGTGVGGGIVIEGHLLHGAHGSGAEIGHMVLNRDETIPCNCGKRGCVEQYCSATGIVRLANEALAATDEVTALRTNEAITCKYIFDCAKSGDALALEVLDRYYRYMGEFLANLCDVVDPDAVVLGGGVSKAGQVLLDGIRPYFDQYVFHAAKDARFALASLGNDAGAYGAFKLALDAFGK